MAKNELYYISGKMTGDVVEVYTKKFKDAADFLLDEYGFDSINPCDYEIPADRDKNWANYLLMDLELLNQCDGIYMLKDWKQSYGAMCEYYFAKGTGKKVIFEK